jgi:hypothetical protein
VGISQLFKGTPRAVPDTDHLIISFGCARGFLGRMRETKVNNTELNWLYSALIARKPIQHSHLMINRWCCEATSGSTNIRFGVLALHVGYLFETEYYKEPEASPTGDFPKI